MQNKIEIEKFRSEEFSIYNERVRGKTDHTITKQKSEAREVR